MGSVQFCRTFRSVYMLLSSPPKNHSTNTRFYNSSQKQTNKSHFSSLNLPFIYSFMQKCPIFYTFANSSLDFVLLKCHISIKSFLQNLCLSDKFKWSLLWAFKSHGTVSFIECFTLHWTQPPVLQYQGLEATSPDLSIIFNVHWHSYLPLPSILNEYMDISPFLFHFPIKINEHIF